MKKGMEHKINTGGRRLQSISLAAFRLASLGGETIRECQPSEALGPVSSCKTRQTRQEDETEGMFSNLFSCVCPYRPKGLKKRRSKNKKNKGPTTADAATSTDDFYLYGSVYEINDNCVVTASIPSTCWTEMSYADFTDDECLAQEERRLRPLPAVSPSPSASPCDINITSHSYDSAEATKVRCRATVNTSC
uniref:Lipocalin n=1 Tax=Steinernema glaseri TaxID=37863 RepID=A0A1I7Z396_9BILA